MRYRNIINLYCDRGGFRDVFGGHNSLRPLRKNVNAIKTLFTLSVQSFYFCIVKPVVTDIYRHNFMVIYKKNSYFDTCIL